MSAAQERGEGGMSAAQFKETYIHQKRPPCIDGDLQKRPINIKRDLLPGKDRSLLQGGKDP